MGPLELKAQSEGLRYVCEVLKAYIVRLSDYAGALFFF